MARKTVTDLRSADTLIEEALEEFEGVSLVKGELATEVYDFQDAPTQRVIDRVKAVIKQHSTGSITLFLGKPHGKVEGVNAEDELLEANYLWLAVEVVKDLAVTGIQVANFKFPPKTCAICGAEVKGKVKRNG